MNKFITPGNILQINLFTGNFYTQKQKQFRQEHLSEITLYETARNFLKQQASSEKLPSMKLLKSEKEKLLSIKNMQHQKYQKRKQYEKELQTVCKM